MLPIIITSACVKTSSALSDMQMTDHSAWSNDKLIKLVICCEECPSVFDEVLKRKNDRIDELENSIICCMRNKLHFALCEMADNTQNRNQQPLDPNAVPFALAPALVNPNRPLDCSTRSGLTRGGTVEACPVLVLADLR